MKYLDKEYILCAAIWYKDLPTQKLLTKNQDKGIIICGHRHGQCIDIMSTLGQLRSVQFGPNSVGETKQGFLTNTNRFVDRKEGMKIAIEAGQVEGDEINIKYPTLFSEDLY